MSMKGLVESEKQAEKIVAEIKRSLRMQQKELKTEIAKMRYILDDPEALVNWRTSLAAPEKVKELESLLSETELMYKKAGNQGTAQLFKNRMKDYFRHKLTNLKAAELEAQLRAKLFEAKTSTQILEGLTGIRRESALKEMYEQAMAAGGNFPGGGGFKTNFGMPFLQDAVTIHTKVAGSKTLGAYMRKLFNTYKGKLNDVLVKGLVRGDSYAKMEQNLIRATGITAGKAKILVRTESNAIFNESIKGVMQGNPLVKGYRFRAVLDSRTSDICQKHDGDYIPKDQVKPGVNYPPLHPNCRSTVTTVLYNEDERKDLMQRYTKNKQNAWIKVPPGTTYNEYKKLFEDYITHTGAHRQANVAREIYLDPRDRRIIVTGPTRIVPNVAASASMLDGQLNSTPGAIAAYDRAKRAEPKITTALLEIGDKTGSELMGVEYSVKTAGSVESKITRIKRDVKKMAEKGYKNEEDIVADMGDLVRYTIRAEKHEDVANVALNVVEDFRTKGIEIIEVDNKYLKKDTTYKGIHIEGMLEGQKFEVQVHSQLALDVKDKNHVIYEKTRMLLDDDPEKAALEEQMRINAAAIPNPKNIEKVITFKKGGK